MSEQLFRVVVNAEGRHALWPGARAVPAGWRETLPPSPRERALEHVEKHWTALAPRRANQPGARATGSPAPSLALPAGRGLDFSLMFFGSDEGDAARDKYEMVLEAARFADAKGFAAVWVPERHFTRMGSLYPNPAVLHAAIARETRRLRLRAGSVVLPLHNPIRVAEEWAVVDNLSNGRVELSFAPGWNPGDFAFAPERYASRYDVLYAGLQTVKRLWAGDTIDATDGEGKPIRVRTYPTPVQKQLVVWITAAGSERSFQQAGSVGAHLLTHLFDQDVEGLAKKVQLYRQARAHAGHDPAAGRVCVALHTFLADTLDEVKEQVRGPYAEYLKSNLGLLEKLAASRGVPLDLGRLKGEELAQAIEWIFEKFLRARSLMGTPDGCADLVEKLRAADVQEVACLVDFGPPARAIIGSLPTLARLAERFRHPAPADLPITGGMPNGGVVREGRRG
jgi:natural product biosynthesis luciferase-like monooxygenase protein